MVLEGRGFVDVRALLFAAAERRCGPMTSLKAGNGVRAWPRALLCLIVALLAVACGSPESGGERGLRYTTPADSGDAGGNGGAGGGPDLDAGDAPPDDSPSSNEGGVDGARTCADTACNALAVCRDTSQGATCTCLPGYAGDGFTSCQNIDECATGAANCSPNATCTDTQGGFTCACNTGFGGDGKTCTDINECALAQSNCSANADCVNTVGSFTCTCKAGYAGDGVACADIDECVQGTATCPSNSVCTNTPGSYTCSCGAGYELSGGVCVSVCQIALATRCDPLATCSVVANVAVCSCPTGYTDANGDGSQCVPNQTCASKCTDPNSTCTVNGSTVQCGCKQGFLDVNGNGSLCQDINECATPTTYCDTNATCSNTTGGYTCSCKTGYSGDGTKCPGTSTCGCTNINECALGTDTCDAHATCSDTSGSYTCTCNAGWNGPGSTGQVCIDVDECTAGTYVCDPNATCINTQGSYTCACKSGFTGNGKTCTDINECTNGTANCDVNATCTNTPGSFTCTCNAGYQGSGTTGGCTNINECALGTDNCDTNATCTDTNPPQMYTCACNVGYTGTGYGPGSCILGFCQLTGTWAVRTQTSISWSNVTSSGVVVIQAGSFTANVWELRQISYDGTTVTNTTKPCGATYPDAFNPTFSEVYGAYVPNTGWDALPWHSTFTDSLPNLVPGSAYTSSKRAELWGIKLVDPLNDPWPTSASQVTTICDATASVKPCWSNDDADNFPAATSWSKPPSQTSATYGNRHYSYVPAEVFLFNGNRTACEHLGARSITQFKGTVVDCNTIKGPMDVFATNSRLHSCRLAPSGSGNGTGDDIDCTTNKDVATGATLSNCTATQASFLDSNLNSFNPTVTSANFAMVRVANTANCATVRATSFPAVP